MLVQVFGALLFTSFAAAQTNSSVVAVFLLGRHGDRTAKVGPGIEGNSLMTTLGANECYDSGGFFRSRYLTTTSPDYIIGANTNYLNTQLYASTENNDLLSDSATAFLQGLYPPSTVPNTQTLANGTTESDPLNGYQYILLNGIPANAPDAIWMGGDQSCPAQTNASQLYYNSTEFLTRKPQLQPFYDKFKPLLAGVFNDSQIGFQTAYSIFDYLNVGYIHNSTIFANLSLDDLFQLRTLADQQSFALVYNNSSPNTSIGGKTLAASILSQLNYTASQSNPKLKITYYAGAYSVMLAFWGLTGLSNASVDFTGLPDYASTMAFELRRPSNATGFDDLFVRFGFRNGSLPSAPLNDFPMFGQSDIDMPWSTWSQSMANISISSDKVWCNLCASPLGFCGGYETASSSATAGGSGSGNTTSGASDNSAQSSTGLSNAAAGGIGAGVTIGVIALIEGIAALVYFRNRRGKSTTGTGSGSNLANEKAPSDITNGTA